MNSPWIEIEDIFRSKNCLHALGLNGGATNDEIAALEEHLGLSLPAAFKSFLAIHNGQGNGQGLFFGVAFLSVDAIQQNWNNWVALEQDGLNEELSDSMSSRPEGFIKPLYLNRKWIPITHDYGGNHIGFDFDPDVNGTPGQIIAFGRDEDEKKLKANSFGGFIELLVKQLRTIDWQITQDRWQINSKEHDVHYNDWR